MRLRVCIACSLIATATVIAQARPIHIVVSVREGSRMVSGLTAEDFTVHDNEMVQAVELTTLDSIPIDVTLVVDTKISAANIADQFTRSVQQISRMLQPGDALRVVRVDTYAEELRSMSPAAGTPSIELRWQRTGLSSLHDALIAALVRPAPAGRAQLVVGVTDGVDTMSINSADRLREVAARSDALLHVVTVRSPARSSAAFTAGPPRFYDANTLILSEAAEQTGGELRSPGLFSDGDLVSSVTRVLRDVRQSYLLTFTPETVEADGWHELSVSLPRTPNATVRARRGYHRN